MEHDSNNKTVCSPSVAIYEEPMDEIISTDLGEGSCLTSAFSSYSMDKPNRGFALIFNNPSCTIDGKGVTVNTANDLIILDSTLNGLGFKVFTFTDLAAADIEAKLNEYSAAESNANTDCFVAAFLNNGTRGTIHGSGSTTSDVYRLTACFKGDKSPLLAGKPKLFLVQAYEKFVTPTPTPLQVNTDGTTTYRLAAGSDIMYVFAGPLLVRDSAAASFTHVLCENITRFGLYQDIDIARIILFSMDDNHMATVETSFTKLLFLRPPKADELARK